MEAGIADHVWSIEELIALFDVKQLQQRPDPKEDLWPSVKQQKMRHSIALVVSANVAASPAPYIVPFAALPALLLGVGMLITRLR